MKANKTILVLIATIILIASSIFVSIMGSKKQNSTNIKNWKTYKNEKYGYEVKYPYGKIAAIQQPWENVAINMADKVVIDIGTSAGAFYIWVSENPSRFTAKEYVELVVRQDKQIALKDSLHKELTIYNQGQQVIDKMNVYWIDVWSPDATLRRSYISKSGKIYEVEFPTASNPNDSKAEEHFKVYEAMLSSFSFIE